MQVEHTTSPDPKDIDFLTNNINKETSAFGESCPFAFFIRDQTGTIIAGCNGFIIYGSIYTDQLWVASDHRKQGVARKLMQQVHDLGLKSGCKMATVMTMSFQGTQAFYEKLGYNVVFESTGYVSGSSCLLLKKIL